MMIRIFFKNEKLELDEWVLIGHEQEKRMV